MVQTNQTYNTQYVQKTKHNKTKITLVLSPLTTSGQEMDPVSLFWQKPQVEEPKKRRQNSIQYIADNVVY